MRRRALESPTFPLYLCVINSGQAQSRALAVCLARLTQPVLLLLLFSRVPGSYLWSPLLSSPLGVEHSPPSNSPRTLTSLQRNQVPQQSPQSRPSTAPWCGLPAGLDSDQHA